MKKLREKWNHWKHLWKTDGEFGFKMDVKISVLFIVGFVILIILHNSCK